jgi:hypothetical protein
VTRDRLHPAIDPVRVPVALLLTTSSTCRSGNDHTCEPDWDDPDTPPGSDTVVSFSAVNPTVRANCRIRKRQNSRF